MKKSLSHLPQGKKDELKCMVEIVREMVPTVEMIILFGSHARGDWVNDCYQENHITYTYVSDFDVLVVTEDKKTAKNDWLWNKVDRRITGSIADRTPTDIIRHHIEDFNRKIEDRYYFFTDIKKEGIWLYNSGKYKLARARRFSTGERAPVAKDDFRVWFKKSREFFDDFDFNFKLRRYNQAAFMLHQATEHAYHAVLLVFSGYKPKVHNIANLSRRVASYNAKFMKIFPRKTKEENRLFKLLKHAYVDARYKKSYRITKKELEYLAGRVKKLHALARRVCKAKIKSFTEG